MLQQRDEESRILKAIIIRVNALESSSSSSSSSNSRSSSSSNSSSSRCNDEAREQRKSAWGRCKRFGVPESVEASEVYFALLRTGCCLGGSGRSSDNGSDKHNFANPRSSTVVMKVVAGIKVLALSRPGVLSWHGRIEGRDEGGSSNGGGGSAGAGAGTSGGGGGGGGGDGSSYSSGGPPHITASQH
ncbi:hypothetical protein HZH66_014547 [Vespula vulgaris]|uniref:Uncharacterized protein n=1 Tax=Vespula vulgaris TaxID=7454 RepID=A0A834MP51_VESVU|nr:hypothetical protein HZH66_014547 [Vespula vulgaris]